MTPRAFVKALKRDAKNTSKSEVDYYAKPESTSPPEHLARFSSWFLRLPKADQTVAREAIRYACEGSLFGLLTYLDNIASLTDENGNFELWFVGENGKRTRLNDPDGDLLTDLFNLA